MELRPTPALDSGAPARSTVVLFDLDATLFDYTSLRLRATATALDGMVSNPESISRELLDLLRPPLTDLLSNLGELPDLRREWDSPEVLAFACLLSQAPERRNVMDLADAARKLNLPEEDISFISRLNIYQNARRLREMPISVDFMRPLSRIRDRWSASFPRHVQVFRDYISAHASLAEGARDLIARLIDLGAQVHVVSEGDTAIQTFKFQSLRLHELVETCVVTDATCGVIPILNELFTFYKDSPAIPPEVVQLYDQLAPYTVKSRAFFSKFLHALRDRNRGNLQERLQSAHFCTKQEWQAGSAFSVVMIGDRYRKDLEPLLQTCPAGARA